MDILEPENDMSEAAPSRWAGLGPRIASAAVLGALCLVILWQGGWLFNLLIILAAMMMIREWNGLTEEDGPLWRIAGLFYVAIPCASILWLRNVHMQDVTNAGRNLVLFFLFIIWATDIGAYFTGRIVGGPKLAPTISPSKTWAGLGGGAFAAATVAGVCHFFSPYPQTLLACPLLGLVLAVIAQGGDLFESWLKRRVGVKDSGTLIPGHGGLLDRVDGMIFTLPLFAWLVGLSGTTL